MKTLEIIIKDLQQEAIEREKQLDTALTLICEAVDNLGDMPVSDAWASYWEARAVKFLGY